MNRRKRGNKRYKTERAFLVRFSTISILIGLIQFSHFFYRARSFALSLQFECKGIVYGVSAMLAENLPQLCAVCMATEPLCCWLELCFIFLLLFFGSFVSTSPEWRMHIYIYKFLSMSIAAWPLIIRIGFPRAEHTFAFFAVGRSSIAKLLIQYVKTLR